MNQRAKFDEYVKENVNAFLAFERSLCRDQRLAEDLTQEALIKLWRAWQREGTLAKSYAYITLNSVFIDYTRQQSRSVPIDHSADQTTLQARPDHDNYPDVDEELRSAVEELPFDLRRVIFLKFYLGLRKPAECAEHLHISAAKVSRDLHRAIGLLRKKLAHLAHYREGGHRGR